SGHDSDNTNSLTIVIAGDRPQSWRDEGFRNCGGKWEFGFTRFGDIFDLPWGHDAHNKAPAFEDAVAGVGDIGDGVMVALRLEEVGETVGIGRQTWKHVDVSGVVITQEFVDDRLIVGRGEDGFSADIIGEFALVLPLGAEFAPVLGFGSLSDEVAA